MLFNSLSFAIFMPIVFILYWLLPHKYRWILLLVASYYFYMSWNVKYVGLILFTTVVSFISAILVEKASEKKNKKLILTVSAIVCLGVLFFFKYFNFATDSLGKVLSMFSINISPISLKLLLPVGISFYTFQTLSYVIDVYRGEIKAERHFGYYATFVSFFPQLVAGPIERTQNLLPQIKEHHYFSYDSASYGLKLMAWGFFKKIVVADSLSAYVSKIYDNPQLHTGFSLLIATLFFTIQIYCDFSGYSDIAIGSSKLMGIDLMTNFQSPYFSQSVKEFWRRWHISLSTWFRDYVYIPLGGNRVGKLRHYLNLMITFFASGLWHGANWTFVIWGGLHGLAQIIESFFKRKTNTKKSALRKCISIVVVFVFVSFAWIFFVSNSIKDAGYVICHLFDGVMSPVNYIMNGLRDIGININDLKSLIPSVILLAVFDYFSLKTDVIETITKQKKIIRWTIYSLFILWIVFTYPLNSSTEFIYFQF